MMTRFCAISKSKLEPLYGRGAGTVAPATGMFAFERMSSFAAPAARPSRNGTIRSSARSAELDEARLALCLNQSSPLPTRRPRLRPPAAAFRLAQDVVPVSERRQLPGMDHPVQTHHQRLALDIELCLVEIADDVLDREADRVFRQDIHDEIFDVVDAAPACRHH